MIKVSIQQLIHKYTGDRDPHHIVNVTKEQARFSGLFTFNSAALRRMHKIPGKLALALHNEQRAKR